MMLKKRSQRLVSALFFTVSIFGIAQAENSFSGATGLFHVPTANVTPTGEVSLQQNNDQYLRPNDRYEQQLDLQWLYSGRSASLNGTVNFSIGLLPRVELGGRLSNFSLKTASGPREVLNDLSGNVKWQFLNWRDTCSAAVGMLDFAGEAQQFTAKYLTGTCAAELAGKWELTLAYADTDSSAARPRGFVGGLSYSPIRYLQLLAENEGLGWNSGFRINSGDLLGKVRLGALAKVHSTVDGTDHSIGINLQLPLGYSKPAMRLPESAKSSIDKASETSKASEINKASETLAAENTVAPANNPEESRWVEVHEVPEYPAVQPPSKYSGTPAVFSAQALTHLLDKAGFEQIQVDVNERRQQVAVAYVDNVYRNAYVDGVALAAGIVANYSQQRGIKSATLIIAKQGLEQVVMEFRPADYVAFLNSEHRAAPIRARFASERDQLSVKPTAVKSRYRLFLVPELNNFVGTERGVHDYSLAALTNLSVQLSRAVQLKGGYRLAIDSTDDFDNNRAFRASRLRTGVANAYLEWAAKPAKNVSLVANVGYSDLQGSLRPFTAVQLALTPFDGRHQLYVNASAQSINQEHETSVIGTYSYMLPRWNTRFVFEGGRFANDQTGYGVSINRYFDDTIVRLFARGQSSETLVAGLAVNVPIGGRRRASPWASGIQIGLEERFKYGLQTTVNRADGTNRLEPAFLLRPDLPANLLEDYLDYQRLNPAYLLSQSDRLRTAYRKFGP